MATRVLLLVGTRRGAFLFASDGQRARWQVRGPLASAGWSFYHLSRDPECGTLYAAGQNNWYGTAVWRSADEGESWQLSSEGLTYGNGEPPVRQVWQVRPAHGAVWAGVDPVGLFRSDDGGAIWRHLPALRAHPDCPEWRGGNGGLCLHSIVPHPTDPAQLWVGIAGGGVLYSADGGASWAVCNAGVNGPRGGLGVQKLAMAAGDPSRFYQQNHSGVYATLDGCRTWTDVSGELPSAFGYALATHPREPETLYTVPTTNAGGQRAMPGGRLAVWRSRSGGRAWERLSRGLPEGYAYCKVLREALATDSLAPCGVYFGTTSGHLCASPDEGESWLTLADSLSAVFSVSAVVLN